MPSRSRLKVRRKIEFPTRELNWPGQSKIFSYSVLPGEQCKGCTHNAELFCDCYMFPEAKWEAGKVCYMATHIKKEVKKESKSIDPIKVSKAKVKGK